MTSEEKIKELSKKSDDLETRFLELQVQLRNNEENDEKRHKDIKLLQEQQHEDDKKWKEMNSIGSLATPLMILIAPLMERFFGKSTADNHNKTIPVLVPKSTNNIREDSSTE